jgi:hypothetical protein
MRALYAPMSVGDYCAGLNDFSIRVNQDYQRNSGLWTSTARSFFLESILLEYPIPKIFLYANIDLSTRRTVKEIVDGQQRSEALRLFYNGKTRLSIKLETEELRGKKYNQLPGEYQTAFLSYQLPIDQFSGVSEADVREAFRRMNSSNVPLNEEEQRNAIFQGPFKWFIQSIGRQFNERLYNIGLFSKRDLIRMADTKSYADIAFALDRGIATTKGTNLNGLYKKYNTSFEQEDHFRELMIYGIEQFIERSDLHDRVLLKPHVFQTIVLILIARRFDVSYADQPAELEPDVAQDTDQHSYELDDLLAALRDPDANPELVKFTGAVGKGTNVASARAIRYLYLDKVI